jgi:hypothetical protein
MNNAIREMEITRKYQKEKLQIKILYRNEECLSKALLQTEHSQRVSELQSDNRSFLSGNSKSKGMKKNVTK